jgi:AcrR family transcriptional regulator
MNSQKIDRRVKYTKHLLEHSLVELMQKYPISKISVKTLCEAADINRSTFYAHYTDQYDLLHQLEQEVIIELEKHVSKQVFLEQTEETVQVMIQILIYIAKNADLFKVLLSENGDTAFQRDIMILAQKKPISDLRNNKNIDVRTSEYLQSFVITGALSLVQKWLQDGIVESPETMADLIAKLLYHGLGGLFS